VEASSRRRFARYVHVKNWNFLFYCSNIAKSENAMLWRMLSRLETCIIYSCIWSVTLAKSWNITFILSKTRREEGHQFENLLPDRHAKFVIIQWITCVVPKLANLLMHSRCALSEPISSSRKTGKLTVCRFI
jgi:hypothetical protein